MNIPMVYVTAAWSKNELMRQYEAANYCRILYEAGCFPICPVLAVEPYLNISVKNDHHKRREYSKELIRRSHLIVRCGDKEDSETKYETAYGRKLGIVSTTLEGIQEISFSELLSK
ncbi:MAG: hypothetical protein K6G84_09600 [Lachnospiraceae bacterium]|nr:hypothetical protein [Lachnospiraceae bacterium]